MLAFQTDSSLHGAKSVRMEQRTTEKAKELIEHAARLCGINASEFTVAAATKAARETVRDYENTVLTPKDHAAFLNALEATEPTAELVDLMKLHAKLATRK